MRSGTVDRATLTAARADPSVFADALIGEPLWPHQAEVLGSPARFRCVLAGRQCGKSRALAVAALHAAYRAPGQRVLILSAGEMAAKRLLAEIAGLASAPLLRGSVVDEGRALVQLSNGSSIVSAPASEKQIRGATVDLLVLDEACQIDEAIWTAARFTILARPGSRVLMASTPYGRQDRFFAVAWRAGERGEVGHASWRWPSTVSPLVDRELLALWRASSLSEREYRQEVLAEWVDEAGSYFPSAELEAVVADYELLPPARAQRDMVVGGCDFGFAQDANAVVLLGVLDDGRLNDELHPHSRVFFVPWLEEHFGMPYSRFADLVIGLGAEGDGGSGFYIRYCLAELNGPGTPVVQQMRVAAHARWGRRSGIVGVNTSATWKENGYGMLRLLIQQGRLILPRHPGLLRQLNNLEFSTSDSGHLRIAVPERLGHDDLGMSLCQAASAVQQKPTGRWADRGRSTGDVLTTGSGTRIRSRPRCLAETRAFVAPRGGDARDDF